MAKLTEADLMQFSGSANWYKHPPGMVYTDGVRFMAERAGAYWLIDAIASYQRDRLIMGNQMLQEFQLWELEVGEHHTATLTCKADSNYKPTITQQIEYTDFPFSIKLYVEGNTLLLPGEH